MKKVSFHLKFPDQFRPSPILMHYGADDGRFRYHTGEMIHPEEWNREAQNTQNKGIRSRLARISDEVYKYAEKCKVLHQPIMGAKLKEHLDSIFHPGKAPKTASIFDQMHLVVDKMITGQILTPKDKKKYSALSIKTFRFTVNLLEKFDPSMTAVSVTMKTYHQFIFWMQSQGYSTNYIGSQIKNWKTIGKLATGAEIYDDPHFKKMTEDTYDIHLNEDELKAMMELNLGSRMALARDWFILDCYTGLRVSDLIMLNKKNYSKGFITIANEKTDEKVVIPVHPYVKKIMDKYRGFPVPVTDVEINRTIKKVAEMAGITDRVLFTITKGGKRVDEYLMKWQMVSCHTARRSFITNLRKAGVPDSIVMKLTGIKSVQTLMRYDKMGSEEAARVASGLKFFQ